MIETKRMIKDLLCFVFLNAESFLVQGRRQVFLQGQRTDFDGNQFADVEGAKVGQVFVLFRHAETRMAAAKGRFHVVVAVRLLLGRFERNGRSVQTVLRARIEFGNLGIRLGKFL